MKFQQPGLLDSLRRRKKKHVSNVSAKSSGFTLIEILVAMAIMALISVGALTILNRATESKRNITENGDRLNSVQRAFLFLSNDIQQITTRTVRDEFGDPLASMKSDLQSSTPYVRLTRLGRRNPAQLPRSNLEHLIYTVEDKVLIRTSFSYADGVPVDLALKRPLLDKVETMSLSFYDGEEWHDYWPLSEDGGEKADQTLPVAVKLNLELTDYGEIERLYAISDKASKSDGGQR
ncbi:type II secretion system minor pseudopilin GspJ [Aliikangiella coralliicola]|uniref:Type II secretion system protein J n=1 Tax=Aliikangiella coralliicola TaxID=2592383 RepID=A0A545U7Q0_9GAMM|nr:type II secretion system minor pseudopilin GspJ [Aliikangiella coralliicola]TQV85500.1 type II secretion system protein GspJ [Aliikangiella coralliicola]